MNYIKWIRRLIGSKKILLVFTSACVVNEQGKVLWQYRSDFSTWGLPGGVLELNETLSECIIREVREETGLEVTPVRLIGVYSSPDLDVIYPNGDEVQQVTFCFETRIKNGSLTPDGTETLHLDWFDPLLPPATLPWYQEMINDHSRLGNEASFQSGSKGNHRKGTPFFKVVRQYIGHQRFIMPAAIAFVQDEHGRVLLVQRIDTGLWEMPGGGMEMGERLDQTAIHETFEETGLQVRPTHLLAVSAGYELNVTCPNGDQLKCVTAMFKCEVVGGILHPDGIETSKAAFYSPDQFPPLMPGEKWWLDLATKNQFSTFFR